MHVRDHLVETHGGAVVNLLEGGGERVRRIFEEEDVTLPVGDWFPLGKNLRVLERLRSELGDEVLFELGTTVPRNAVFPPHVGDVVAALDGIDVAFHMNHRKSGVPMFDPSRGMLEGIGHYHAGRTGERSAISIVTSVYPCAFDRGIVTAIARRFEREAAIAHGRICRGSGDACCIYYVTW